MATRGARRRDGAGRWSAAAPPVDADTAVAAIRSHAIPVPIAPAAAAAAGGGASRSWAAARVLLDLVPASARIVMLGEATHGTREFYEQRSELTKLLIAERGFTAVVVESDWPDAARVNRYVRGMPPPPSPPPPEAHTHGLGAVPPPEAAVQAGGGPAGGKPDASADEALGDYKRFPRWMWRNRTVAEFVEWLRDHNINNVRSCGADAGARGSMATTAAPAGAAAHEGGPEGGGMGAAAHADAGRAAAQCGFYGMDVYSLHASAEAVLRYLREIDPQAARVVEARYRCFDRHGADAQSYGLATSIFHHSSCEEAVRRALAEVRRRVGGYRAAPPDRPAAHEAALELEANALVVAGAEAYYRNMFSRDEVTWNLRDRHFLATLQLVEAHLGRLQRLVAAAGEVEAAVAAAAAAGGGGGCQPHHEEPRPKLVLWAHNRHLGDARHTDAGWRRGQLNLGQLVRQAYPRQEVLALGFSTHTGHVTAADDWGEPARRQAVRPSLPGAYEHLMHTAAVGGGGGGGGGGRGPGDVFVLDLHRPELAEALAGPRLQRAIGVVYRPDTELQSHYFEADLPRQFDLLVHVESTAAVHPLDVPPPPRRGRSVGGGGGEDDWSVAAAAAVSRGEAELGATHGDMPELWPSGV
ncbi:hypothetical protein HXX76_006264 [Chlamydomonas incerta]|uniref:Erythromycin esterase n=1 Tax=Chlamydomonas incerta TaxID=51695 RepID=A0A835TDC4_CHLIN|nr:hypothetical protein HXX76_006264 [Chlamydomonas incerta]|eukprot:KAG2436740.1 hypothetical protein HXX76_006264 [Chlamydomonas incerta]